MIGTDIDPEAVEKAKEQVEENRLEDKIDVKLVEADGDFFDVTDKTLTFSMCNPPFYASFDEMEQSMAKKKSGPSGELKAAQTELVTEGGELGFLQRMIEDSRKHKDVFWFTSMIGKKDTMEKVCQKLKDEGVYHSVVSRRPGKTVRWFIAWTFHQNLKHERIHGDYDKTVFEKILVDNDIPFSEKDGLVVVKGDRWSRKYKRAKLRREAIEEKEEHEFLVKSDAIIWKRGNDRQLWDSFTSWVLRKYREDKKEELVHK